MKENLKGKCFKRWEIPICTSKGNASDQDYTDETGATTSLKQNSQVNETFLNLWMSDSFSTFPDNFRVLFFIIGIFWNVCVMG